MEEGKETGWEGAATTMVLAVVGSRLVVVGVAVSRPGRTVDRTEQDRGCFVRQTNVSFSRD